MFTKLTILTALLGMTQQTLADVPSTHGMLLFGDQGQYASHLPMFHSPHDYQVVLKIKMEAYPRSMTLTHYKFAKDSGKELFTLLPERMDLTKIMDGSITKFEANLYEGHFEQGGVELGPVKVQVQKIVYSQKITNLLTEKHFQEYLVFGEGEEFYALHKVTTQPSYDAILKVSAVTEISIFCKPRRVEECYEDNSTIQYPLLMQYQETSPLILPRIQQILYGKSKAQTTTAVEKIVYFNTSDLQE